MTIMNRTRLFGKQSSIIFILGHLVVGDIPLGQTTGWMQAA
jgi:hypothetical protein